MFNFSGSEIVFLLLLALIILGPEKLPEAIRKFGQTYAEFKKVTTGFQSELKQALDEPMREMRETAEMFKQAATFDVTSPLEEAAASLKSVTDPGPAAATPAADRVDPAVSLAAADAADAAETAAAEAAASAAADAAGAAPPLASAATATPEPAVDEPAVDEPAVDAPAVDTPAPRRAPVAPKPPASLDDEHRPFESKIISGRPKQPTTLDDVVSAGPAATETPATETPATDPGTPPA